MAANQLDAQPDWDPDEHGFETRIRGFTTDEYVAAVQRQIGIGLESIVGQPG